MATCTNLHPAVTPAALAQLRSDPSKDIRLSVGGRTIVIFFYPEKNNLFIKISEVFDRVLSTDQKVLSLPQSINRACIFIDKNDSDLIKGLWIYTFQNNDMEDKVLPYDDDGNDLLRLCPYQHTKLNGEENKKGIYTHFTKLDTDYEPVFSKITFLEPGKWTLGEGEESVSFQIPETVEAPNITSVE